MNFPDVPIIVISLPDAIERREKMQAQMERLGLSFRFFDAYTPETIPEDLRPQFFDEKGEPHGNILLPGEIGCYASHLGVMKLLACGAVEEPLLVLEDDTIISNDSLEKIAQIAKYMMHHRNLIDYVHLHHSPLSCPQEILQVGKNVKIHKPFYPSVTTLGYLASKKMAQKFLNWKKKRILPVDVDMRFLALTDLQYWEALEPLVFQGDTDSLIDPWGKRKSKERKEKRKGIYSRSAVFAAARKKYGTLAFWKCLLMHTILKSWFKVKPPSP